MRIIYGAGGHGRVLLDIARENGVEIDAFVDDSGKLTEIESLPVIRSDKASSGGNLDFIVGIGSNEVRRRIYTELSKSGVPFNLIHGFRSFSKRVVMGTGVVTMPGVVINTGTTIGNNVILNTCCSIDHDCIIEDHVHICPGVRLAGAVSVGSGTMIGTGSSVIPGMKIGENCVIGAGSVIVRDIPPNSRAYGVPARVAS
jgi:sugar O-acyltransferase (sialic acid O-acetyltransferase NeuD family)